MSKDPVPQETWNELAQIVVSELTLSDLLDQVARLAQRTISEVVDASVTLIDQEHAYSAAFTGPVALKLDERQYEAGYGPCLDAADSGTVLQLVDTKETEAYQAFAKEAVAHEVRSTLAVGLPVGDGLSGALNLYSGIPGRFDPDTVGTAKTFASYAAVALTNTSLYENAVAVGDNLRRALESRAVIEQAKGILIADHHCDADAAFRLLSQLSQTSNRKLRDVATALVEERIQRGRPG